MGARRRCCIFFGVALLVGARDPRRSRGALGWPATRHRRRRRGARARQRAAQPAAHRVDRGRADDRPRARHARRGARRRDHVELPRRRQRTLARTPTTRSPRRTTSRRSRSPRPTRSRKTPGVEAVATSAPATRRRSARASSATAVNPPARDDVQARLEGRLGRRRSPTLGDDGAFVDKDYAKKHHLHSRLAAPADVRERRAASASRCSGIFDPPTGGSPFGQRDDLAERPGTRYNANPQNLYSFVRMRGGETTANRAALDARAEDVPEREGRRRASSSSTTRSAGSTRS